MVRECFFEILGAKYTYLQGFQHADFVNLIWPLEAPGPLGRISGAPRPSKVGFGKLREGLEKKGSCSVGLQGESRT